MFFSIGKIFWLLVIIWGVWTAFRLIEKRRETHQKKAAAKAADPANAAENRSENAAGDEKNTSAGSVDMVECPTCKSWVDPAGCHHPQCGLK